MIMVICNGRARTRPSGEAVGLFEELKKGSSKRRHGWPVPARRNTPRKRLPKAEPQICFPLSAIAMLRDCALECAAARIRPTSFVKLPMKPRKAGPDPREKRQLLRPR